jgi:integrase
MGATETASSPEARSDAVEASFGGIAGIILYRSILAITTLAAPPLSQLGNGTLAMASFEKRGKNWRAIVRRKGEPRRTATFPTKAMAQTWVNRIEREIAQRRASGASDADSMTLRSLIDWYVESSITKFGRSKAADLTRLKNHEIADRVASGLRTQDYVRHAESRRRDGTGPATVLNDLVWLRQVIKAARASRGLNASLEALDDATEHLRRNRVIAKSRARNRRLRDGEEGKLMAYFAGKGSSIPMGDIVAFALASARRQEEITRIRWADVDKEKGIAWLDDIKHPARKEGNRKSFRLLPEALAIIERQPRGPECVFPYNSKTVGALFTRAVAMLGLPDLRFHDLRHEATSRLFERGYAIHEVAQFTLHESWATLKRYTNLRPEDVPVKG